jgi:hypothetical protein
VLDSNTRQSRGRHRYASPVADADQRNPQRPDPAQGLRSRLVGELLEVRVPCCVGTIRVPTGFAHQVRRGGPVIAFVAGCPCGNAHLGTAEADGMHLRITADPRMLGRIVATIPWPSLSPEQIGDTVFEAKPVPSTDDLLDHLEKLGIRVTGPPPTSTR